MKMFDLQEEVHANAIEKGFWNSDNFGEKIALIHSELSEALEAHRKAYPLVDIAEELADVTIRVMDLCEHLGIDLWQAVINKHNKNKKRPYLHGKKY